VYAAFRDDHEMCKCLLAHGANALVVSDCGTTPLMGAASHGDARLVNELLTRGVDAKRVGPGGVTALSLAIGGGHEEIARMIRSNTAAKKNREF
jgi:ankyrin repeat protein